jgi:hypothetical protein
VIVSFLLGLLPMWLLNKTQRFYMSRRISSLETAARSAATTPVAAPEPEPGVPVEQTPVPKEDVLDGTPPPPPPADDTPDSLKPEER